MVLSGVFYINPTEHNVFRLNLMFTFLRLFIYADFPTKVANLISFYDQNKTNNYLNVS